jgi:hypothetical protein
MARLTVHGRELLVERVVRQGWPVARAAEAEGVSAATARRRNARFSRTDRRISGISAITISATAWSAAKLSLPPNQ